MDIARNHTATHLLNWALREVLGDHVNQAGSVVAADRLRFDFSHGQAVSAEDLAKVERWVNEKILADLPVSDQVMALADAQAIPGVRAMFGEKYPDPVRVVTIGGWCSPPRGILRRDALGDDGHGGAFQDSLRRVGGQGRSPHHGGDGSGRSGSGAGVGSHRH